MQMKLATHRKETRGIFSRLADMRGSTNGCRWWLYAIDLLRELHQKLASLQWSADAKKIWESHLLASQTIFLHQPRTN